VLVKGFDATVDLGVVAASAEHGRVTAKAVRGHEKGSWTVEIRLPEGAPVGPVRDRVLLKTAVPGEESVAIEVAGEVVERRR